MQVLVGQALLAELVDRVARRIGIAPLITPLTQVASAELETEVLEGEEDQEDREESVQMLPQALTWCGTAPNLF